MAICTSMKALSRQVEDHIKRYEELAQDETLEGIESTSFEDSLDRLYSLRKAIKNDDRAYIKAHGITINDLKGRSEIATRVFRDVIGSSFSFREGNSSALKIASFTKAELVDGGIKIHYSHKGVAKDFTFSLTTDERSTNKGNKFIKVPGFRDFLDSFSVAERNVTTSQLVLGSEKGNYFKLGEEDLEKNYVHGNVDNMKEMLKKLHVLGGNKASDEELETYLGLIERMDPSMFNKLKLYIEKDAETSKGVAIATKINIKIKGDPKSLGNQQSEASIYMEEVLHSMTMSAISSKTIKSQQLKRRLDRLVELGRKQVKVTDFLPDPKDSIDPVKEQKFAEELYTYIFNSENTDYEFLAKGIAQPEVAKALSKIRVKDNTGNKSLLTRFMDMLDYVFDVIAGNIVAKNKNQSVHDALVQLAFELGSVNSKASQKALEAPSLLSKAFNLVLNDTDRAISTKLHNLTKDSIDQMSKKEFTGMPDTLYDRVKFVAKAIPLSMVNPVYAKAMGVMASSWGLKPEGTVREIIGGLFQTDTVQQAAEFLILQSGYVDKKRNEQIAITRASVLHPFKEAPTKEEEEAMTAVLMDTDLAALFGKESSAYKSGIVKTRIFDNATIRKLLTDEESLDKLIVEAKRALKDLDTAHYSWHANQATGLGIYMATHQGTPSQNQNAFNIARGIHSSHSKKPKENVVAAIDELATLVAIKNTDQAKKNTVAELMKKDYRAVQQVADMVEGFKINSMETVFKRSKTNMIKGYSKEVFDDSVVMEVGTLADRESMEKQGFKFVNKLAPKFEGSRQTPMALYITDSASRPERLRGGIRLNQLRSKGQTITDSQYKESEGSSNALIREKAKREINQIKMQAIKEAKQMEEGEFDFTDTTFGLTPLINNDGKVLDYRYGMSKDTKASLLKQDTRISEVLGRSFGSLLDKDASAQHNKKVLEEVKKDMKENWKEGKLGKDGLTEFTLVGPDVSDPEMRKLYYMLPREFQEFIKSREDKTLAVRSSLKNLYFGYSQLSIADFPMLKKVTPKVLITALKFAESMYMELVQIAKTNILMKMPTVTISNFLSNFLYLAMKGYNPVEILGMQVESFRAIKRYNANTKRQQLLTNQKRELVVAKEKANLSKDRQDAINNSLIKVEGELNKLDRDIKDSRIHELVQMGLDQSVEDISNEVTRDTNKVSQFFEEKMENVPSLARIGVDYLFLTKRTVPYKVVNEFLEITDLMSRDIQNTMEKRTEERQANGSEPLPTWWVDKQPEGYLPEQPLTGEEKAKFLKEAEAVRKYELVEDYINYALPSSQFEEYLNKVGILMFTKYVKRIQRIIVKTGSKGPIKSLLGLSVAGYMGGLPTIHEQSFLVKDWYTDSIGPGNVFPIYMPPEILMNVITPALLKESTTNFGW